MIIYAKLYLIKNIKTKININKRKENIRKKIKLKLCKII